MRSRNPRSSRNDGCGNIDYSGSLSFLRVPDARVSHRDGSHREYVGDQRVMAVEDYFLWYSRAFSISKGTPNGIAKAI